MNKSFKKFLKIYLIIGVFWGLLARLPFGIMLSEYSGNHRYPNRITEVENAFISEKGDVILCVKGRLSMSDIDDSPIESFSLKIPIQEILINEKYNQNGIRISENETPWIYLSSNVISPKCNSMPTQLKNISISQVDLTPKKAYHFDDREMKKYQVLNDDKYTVYVAAEYYENIDLILAESIKVFLVSRKQDVKDRNFYFIYLDDTWIDRNIGIHEYAIAFIKDALFYPFAIIMMGSWGH